MNGGINMASDNIKVVIVKIGGGHYVVNQATDQYLGVAVAGADIMARTGNLSSKTTAAGVFGAANTLFAAVAAGSYNAAIVIIKDSGADATSPLIWYNSDYAGLTPFAPTGANVNLSFPPTDPNKIFKL